MNAPRTALHLAICLLAVSWSGGGLAADEPKAPKPADEETAADRMFRLRVDVAVTRGAEWLAKQQHEDGAFRRRKHNRGGPMMMPSRHDFGETALATLTLAHCGFGPETRVIKKALAYLKKNMRSMMKGDYHARASTYSLSIYVLALHQLYGVVPGSEHDDKDASRYGNVKVRKRNPCQYPKFVQSTLREIVSWLVKNQAATGLFRYPSGLPDMPGDPRRRPGMPGQPPEGMDFSGPEDMSNTQYVLLAFWVASICGKPVKEDVLKRIANRLLEVQEKQGPAVQRRPDPLKFNSRYAPGSVTPKIMDQARGFGYTARSGASGSMTTGGLSSLLIVKSMLEDLGKLDDGLRSKLDQAVWDAIAWMDVNYDVHSNPRQGPSWHYYYLYGLERAFVIARKRYIGERDWYRDGASMLIRAQQKSGRWFPDGSGHGPMGPQMDTALWDTCFALLFLKRAAVHPRRPPLNNGPVTTPSTK